MTTAYAQPKDRRLAGIAFTGLIHLALILGWQATRPLPQPQTAQSEGKAVQWITLPEPSAQPSQAASRPAPAIEPVHVRDAAPRPRRLPPPALPQPSLPATPSFSSPAAVAEAPAAAAPNAPASASASATAGASPQNATPPAPSAEQILQRAKRDIGSIDKALRKENRPYIAAPLDSPQIRMQRGMEEAHAMAAPRLWEAPKVEELVNNTGDGARRTRVITGNGTYCVTERSTHTDVEMIEHHGKIRLTNCPAHEGPATQQKWRTLQD